MKRLLTLAAIAVATPATATEFYLNQYKNWEISGSNGVCVVAQKNFAITFDLENNNKATVIYQTGDKTPTKSKSAVLSFKGTGNHYFNNKTKHFNWSRTVDLEGTVVYVPIDYHFFDIIGTRGQATQMNIVMEGRAPIQIDLTDLADAARFTKDCRKEFMGD